MFTNSAFHNHLRNVSLINMYIEYHLKSHFFQTVRLKNVIVQGFSDQIRISHTGQQNVSPKEGEGGGGESKIVSYEIHFLWFTFLHNLKDTP